MKQKKYSPGRLLRLDRESVWHPYTQMKDYETLDPVLVEKASGVRIFDRRGSWYYDLSSSWWSSILGHNVPAINRAIRLQLEKFEHVLFAGTTNEPSVRLARLLTEISHPRMKKVFFSDN